MVVGGAKDGRNKLGAGHPPSRAHPDLPPIKFHLIKATPPLCSARNELGTLQIQTVMWTKHRQVFSQICLCS